MTMPAFLQERYGTRWLKIAAAFVIFLFLVPYSASVYTGLAYLFEEVFEVDYTFALWAMAILTGVYLVLGGYFAVARNDLIQGLVMIVGVILMVGYIVRAPEVGGFGEAYDKLKAAAPPDRGGLAAVEPLAVQLGRLLGLARRGPALAGDPHQPRRVGPAADGAQVLRDPRHQGRAPGDRHLDPVRGADGVRRLLRRRAEPAVPGDGRPGGREALRRDHADGADDGAAGGARRRHPAARALGLDEHAGRSRDDLRLGDHRSTWSRARSRRTSGRARK